MSKHKNMIYFSHGKKIPIAIRAKVNGKTAIAFVKGTELIAYETWEDLGRQLMSGNYTEFNAPNMRSET